MRLKVKRGLDLFLKKIEANYHLLSSCVAPLPLMLKEHL
jgi:hypothetical protein